jgi:hypothetical protein
MIQNLRAFSHPDYTVGFGVAPNHAAKQLADFTAGRESHPAPKACFIFFFSG